AGEVEAERLAEPLRLVVAGARAGARDVSPVVLSRRDRLGNRVAVDLAAREEEDAAELAASAVVEEPPQAGDVGVDRLDRKPAVEGRRGDAGRVDDVVELELALDGPRDVALLDRDVRLGAHRLQPGRHAARKGVPDRELDRLAGADAAVPG